MLEGQKCLVIGSGISGIGAAVLLEKNHADVVLYDSSDKLTKEDLEAKLPGESKAVCIAGELPEEVELSIQAAVLSPGVPTDIPLVNRMRDRGVQILGEIELGFLAEQGRVIAITGTNGKTTTTSLIYHIFKSAGLNVGLAGNIGNSLEVMESMDVLKGKGPADLTEVCLQLAANMLVLAGKGTPAECRAMAQAVIADGSAFAKCKEMFAAQGGDTRVLDDYSLFEQPAASFELLAEQDGYIVANDAEKIGSASVLLGAGRQKKGDPLDFAAGITLHKKRGDYVHKGESLATFYGAADKFEAAAAEYRSGLVYGAEKPEEAPLVYALVTKDGVERY